jgi:RNA polymerase sigma-70 factor (ECF subfamily)
VDADRAAEIVEAHQKRVFRLLGSLLGRTDDLEDLAQEVFLRLFRALPLFRGEAQLSTYIYRIAVNVAQDEWGRRRRYQSTRLPIDEKVLAVAACPPATEQEIARKQLFELVNRCLEDVSPPERAVFLLYHQEERSYEEIAAILEIPIGTVRTHLHRGRQKIKAMIHERMKHEPRRDDVSRRS